jgi:hypothetical protein
VAYSSDEAQEINPKSETIKRTLRSSANNSKKVEFKKSQQLFDRTYHNEDEASDVLSESSGESLEVVQIESNQNNRLKRSTFSSLSLNKNEKQSRNDEINNNHEDKSQKIKKNDRLLVNNSLDKCASSSSSSFSSSTNSQTLISSNIKPKEYSVDEMLSLAEKKTFPRKAVVVGQPQFSSIKYYTATLNFFSFKTNFTEIPNEKIKFKCIACCWETYAVLGETRNLNVHLKVSCKSKHLKNWYKLYKAHKIKIESSAIDDNLLCLIRYFLRSNSSIDALKDPDLRELLKPKISLPGPFSFRNTILPSVMDKLKTAIEFKLRNASSVCLITDLWTNTIKSDFVGLAAVLTDNSLNHELLVIGMMKTPGNHNSETIKLSVETMVNSYNFDKSKIIGNCVY